jgi:ATP-binding cassette subfamily B (MDR/TAP) protein 1
MIEFSLFDEFLTNLSLCSIQLMWPIALVALGCLPFMGLATSFRVKRMYGTDKSGDSTDNTAGGILVETLLNMRIVAALRLEQRRYSDYKNALENADAAQGCESLTQGIQSGLSIFVMLWTNALQFWFGGWLLYHYPILYDYNDFLIANLASRFALFGLGFALQDVADSKALEASAKRIFYLLDRKSTIDPLSEEGHIIV